MMFNLRERDTPEGEDAQLLHDVEFARLIKVEDVREEAGVPIKIKLLLLHVIVVTHLQEGGGEKVEIRSKNKGKKGETFPHLQDVLL